MKWWTSVVLLVLILSGCTSYDIERAARRSTHYLVPSNQTGHCSSTAVGPHALLTAEHCDDGANSVWIDGAELTIDGRIKDKSDHVIYLFDHARFGNWSEVVPFDFNTPLNVFTWGSPGQYSTLFRRGTISNVATIEDELVVIVDLNIFYGDSGAAIFNEYGQIVLVVNELAQDGHISQGQFVALKFAACQPLTFTQDQLMKAETYGTTGADSHKAKR